jgi:hypothetical protein
LAVFGVDPGDDGMTMTEGEALEARKKLDGIGWCQTGCSVDYCQCWEVEQRKRRADLDRQERYSDELAAAREQARRDG